MQRKSLGVTGTIGRVTDVIGCNEYNGRVSDVTGVLGCNRRNGHGWV